ncbi:diacylglycerol kinase [Campylobacter mucosalis]|uniref:diacylglycerol kinase n=1 Tax=Campylobacter mucosalis TaxID=202 RepID=UPI0004DA7D12|nr:diacylglycerol kinase [Campylobacter mucosalis]KEA45202.1 diacylglycerol kinase [Campylobacter mucosalis]QKF63754.1 diacylglycerol kinase [Campylobacter mucosalis]
MRNQPKYKFLKNWGYAIKGLAEIYKNEQSFRLEIWIFAPLAFSLMFWNFGAVLNLFLIFCMAFVLVVECLNSAIERVVDLASADFHTLAGAAKDAGSAAVMIANILCAFTWLYAFFSRFS